MSWPAASTLMSRLESRLPWPRRLRNAIDHWRLGRRLAGRKLLHAFAAEYPNAFFIEVGSNDGENADYLRPFILGQRWSGVMVEPVPYVFERLRENYAGLDRIAFENVAIADHDGVVPFYYLAEKEESEELPTWYDAIGSLSPDVVKGSAVDPSFPDLERRLVSARVPCMTFESLCRKHGVERLDLVLIDTEGYDHEVIRQIDFTAHPPTLLVYEHFHFLPDQRADCRALLEREGYALMEEGLDTFCLRPTANERLAHTWRQLNPALPGLSVHELRAMQDQQGS